VAGLRGLEPVDVISTMFIAAHGGKVSGPTIFAETKNNSVQGPAAALQIFFWAPVSINIEKNVQSLQANSRLYAVRS
jgi:hypothetical protein